MGMGRRVSSRLRFADTVRDRSLRISACYTPKVDTASKLIALKETFTPILAG